MFSDENPPVSLGYEYPLPFDKKSLWACVRSSEVHFAGNGLHQHFGKMIGTTRTTGHP